ncbi:hypothetical protein PV327_000993 [Microctonus hyperodae]|uniref:MD-2-related lipid-recognition domain-containing protein n=1 Tax=Microctonus hyperodae TaxID=165561 RepID=A0AA39L2Y6_MICHY|nr:hypothetical protein PV327_000993 [Microctonus hyperodae]
MFKSTFFILATIFCLVILADGTKYRDCQNVKSEVNDAITSLEISGCEKPPCKLRRGTTTFLHETFIPNRNINQLKTSVKAILLNLPVPFIGVDNVDASKDIYTTDGQKAEWPLIAGREYHYNNSFAVEKFYPTVAPIVHWALVEGNDVVTCFLVNARIV